MAVHMVAPPSHQSHALSRITARSTATGRRRSARNTAICGGRSRSRRAGHSPLRARPPCCVRRRWRLRQRSGSRYVGRKATGACTWRRPRRRQKCSATLAGRLELAGILAPEATELRAIEGYLMFEGWSSAAARDLAENLDAAAVPGDGRAGSLNGEERHRAIVRRGLVPPFVIQRGDPFLRGDLTVTRSDGTERTGG